MKPHRKSSNGAYSLSRNSIPQLIVTISNQGCFLAAILTGDQTLIKMNVLERSGTFQEYSDCLSTKGCTIRFNEKSLHNTVNKKSLHNTYYKKLSVIYGNNEMV